MNPQGDRMSAARRPKPTSKTTKVATRVEPKEDPKRRQINFSLTEVERDRVHRQIEQISKDAGIPVSPTSYAKHAMLEHARYRAIESRLRWLLKDAESGREPAEWRAAIEGILTGWSNVSSSTRPQCDFCSRQVGVVVVSQSEDGKKTTSCMDCEGDRGVS
jgi:hypothetical protein